MQAIIVTDIVAQKSDRVFSQHSILMVVNSILHVYSPILLGRKCRTCWFSSQTSINWRETRENPHPNQIDDLTGPIVVRQHRFKRAAPCLRCAPGPDSSHAWVVGQLSPSCEAPSQDRRASVAHPTIPTGFNFSSATFFADFFGVQISKRYKLIYTHPHRRASWEFV